MRGKNNIVPLPGLNTSDATATADKILSSYTAYGGNGKITGTMPDNGETNHTLPINGSYTIPKGYHNGSGRISQSITTKSAETYTPTTSNQTIAAGRYLSGDQIIKGDNNLVAGNIKKGISIFGVVGEYEGDVLNKIQIVTQPTNTTAYTGGTYSFTVEATGRDLTYLWQQRAVSPVAGNWEDTSHTTATYTATTSSDVIGATWEFRCKVTNPLGFEVWSEVATLTLVSNQEITLHLNEWGSYGDFYGYFLIFDKSLFPVDITPEIGESSTDTFKAPIGTKTYLSDGGINIIVDKINIAKVRLKMEANGKTYYSNIIYK